MNHIDFLDNFPHLYACRILEGWKKMELQSEWKGKSSPGLAGRLTDMPQFKLRLSEPGTTFIMLRQFGKGADTFTGPLQIVWVAAKLDGYKLQRFSKQTLVKKTKKSNAKALSEQVNFDESVSYPYTYTILAGTPTAGSEGKFEIVVYSKDNHVSLTAF